ncbi:hypothetical protein K1T71_014132 [Dendrolimus kikuchii]|uniref:Uncharacterized protein n=1 Tax=Dendrolimus kikuchii TaxID=765133 RepID=A0ACC1CF45_9NEOP|nr:hypothetical protein K1T71_014132 [Dendrolimus kikuchii]
MFKGDDDDDPDNSVGAVRYPCMPSLVALQQMRNRLNLAHLGKKLMKWTAVATGKELRRLSCEIIVTYRTFSEDVRNAFILLARCRYFYPNLNKMVLENVPKEAAVTVSTDIKSMSGVKVTHLNIIDSGVDSYEHLGIDKGGQVIFETKEAWRNLLKRIVLMLDQKISFQQVELAHKSATKKGAVLDKIIIPRITATIAYIKSQLEENEREEIFRLKRFKQLKYKHSKKDDIHICCCCLSMFESQEDTTTSVCPVCQKAAKAKKTTLELKVNVIPCKNAIMTTKENVKRLEHLLSHIDEVIDLTKQYKTEGILSPSMEKFIKTCNLAKEKIEDFANAPPLCDVCRKSLEHAGSRVNLEHSVSKTASFKSAELPPCGTCDQPSEETDNTFEISPDTDDNLGYFEKKFKEIIKVTRLKNDDGSVSEEKQVITIRTERKNPRKTAMDFTNQPIGPAGGFGGGGFGGGGKRGERPCSRNKDINGGNDSNRSRDFGGDGGSDYCNIKPRETKSEHINCSHQMGEPKLRPCMSVLNPKPSTNRDASTNFNSDSFSSIKTFRVKLPPQSSTSLKTPCSALPKMDMTSSIDSQMCCPKRMPSACSSELQSGKSSQVSVSSCRAITTSSSAQTCCKEIPVKKPIVDKGTCCLPVCGGDTKCLDDKNTKSKSIATNALWRDAWTSTTDLTAVPSTLSSKKTSPEPNNVFDCVNKDSNEDTGKKGITVPNSCCTIKLIAKPPKVRTFEKAENKAPKEEQKEIVLSGSMLDAIKKICVAPSRSTESCKVDTAVPKTPEIKNICKSCLSKLNSEAVSKSSSVVPPVPSTKSSNISSTCKMCQAKVDEPVESEVNSCVSCGTIAKSSSASLSCKSIAIGSPTSSITNTSQHTCSKPATPSLHSEKHSCCLSKKSSHKSSSDDDDDNTRCAMAQTKSSKSVCCSKSKTESICCPSKKGSNTSQQSVKTQASCSEKKDAGTCTKRSAKYDVRPLRRQPNNGRLNLNSCVCKSDPRLNRDRHHRPNQCKSFHEDDYYYFRW